MKIENVFVKAPIKNFPSKIMVPSSLFFGYMIINKIKDLLRSDG